MSLGRHELLVIKKIISHNWKALKSKLDFVKSSLKWEVRNGSEMNFLNDRWLSHKNLERIN